MQRRPDTARDHGSSTPGTSTNANSNEDNRTRHPKCIFCQVLSNRLPSSQLYEDSVCRVIMDIHPIRPGHVLIIPRDHYKNIMDMPEDVALHMMQLAYRITAALTQDGTKSQFDCDGTNLLWNNGREAWQTVMHAHLHVIPRRRGDSLRFVFGLLKHLLSLFGIIPPANRKELDKLATVLHNVLSKHVKSS